MRLLASLILLAGFLLIAAPFVVKVEREPAGGKLPSHPAEVGEETMRGSLRDVTPQDMTQPPDVSGQTLTRLPPVAPPPEPARPPKPIAFALPRVVSAGVIESGETAIALAGIDALAADERCHDADGEWPCGAVAKTALQRLVRQRTIECDPPAEGEASGKAISTACRVGGMDLAEWLVRQGWAMPAGSRLSEALAEAQAARRGQWGGGPD